MEANGAAELTAMSIKGLVKLPVDKHFTFVLALKGVGSLARRRRAEGGRKFVHRASQLDC